MLFKGTERMLTVITLDEAEKWNNLVRSFKYYDIYYLSNYVKAFKIHGDGEPMLFFYEDESIRAINIVMKRDIADDKRFSKILPPHTFFDIATPYGYGGFLIEGNLNDDSLQALNDEYSSLCSAEGIISEIVRFHPVLNNSEGVNELYDVCKLGKTITVTLSSKDEIWKNLNTNKKRWIKKATETGVEVYSGRSQELFSKFKSMYNETMKKNNAKEYYFFNEDFYKSVFHDMEDYSFIFYAVYEKRIIGMVLVIYENENGKIHHHFSASDINFQHLAPTNLLMYEIACWGNANGFNTFHLGGGVGSREDSLYEFKKGFNKNSDTTFSIGKKIFNEEKYQYLMEIRKRDCNFDDSSSFFPQYRA